MVKQRFLVISILLIVVGVAIAATPAASSMKCWPEQTLQRGSRATSAALRRLTPPRDVPPAGPTVETTAGWVKAASNPVLGGALGTVFDVAALKEQDVYRLWFSWRPQASIAVTESRDGVRWEEPTVALRPNPATGWEDEVNRPVVVRGPDGYHMWYTGQAGGRSWIGHATSADGKTWARSERPVLAPDQCWEKEAVMAPHVLWDDAQGLYRMWYSGGEQYEPDAIGYATSRDGQVWTKLPRPVFSPTGRADWEGYKVTAAQVIRQGDWYIMFYIGFADIHRAQIGVARSRDGVSGWERHPANPIIRPGPAGAWDHDAVYKPFALLDGETWRLWYNARLGTTEQIGLALRAGADLGFDDRRQQSTSRP